MQYEIKKHLKKKILFNLCEKRSLTEAVEKVLNVNSLQSTIKVKPLNVQAVFLNAHSSEISDLKKKLKNKKTVFVKIDAVKQQKVKSEFLSSITLNSKNKIIKKC